MTTPEADRLSQIKARLEKAVADEAATEEPDRCANFDELRDALSLVEQLQREKEEFCVSVDNQDRFYRMACERAKAAELTSARLRTALEQLLANWRQMVAASFADGPIPGDETGHMSRWTMAELLANELEAALGEPDGRRVP
jgi:hypothetical protein